MGLNRTVAPATYPVSLAEAKAQCRITNSDSDVNLNALIAAATTRIENITERSLITQTWELTLDGFSDAIALPRGPVASITSVEYYDADGILQTLAADVYTFDGKSDPQWIVRNTNRSWPQTEDGVNAVAITYVAGKAALSDDWIDLKHAILLLIAHWFDDREGREMSAAAESLIAPFRARWVGA